MSTPRDSYHHLIIGGGVAADKAARAIRKADPETSIGILSADGDGPVYRPALTKDLWHGEDEDPASQDLHTVADTGAELFTGVEVTALDPAAHTVTTTQGHTVSYGQLLLATGSTARRFGAFEDERLIYLRGVSDYRRLRELARPGKKIAVVGGGYIGSEIAAGLSTTGAEVSTYFMNETLLDNMFPPSITTHLEKVFAAHGIRLFPGFQLDSLELGEQITLHDKTGQQATADVVVLGLGAVLNTRLAEAAGLELRAGAVAVDARLRTSAEDIFAAGDIAHFEDPIFGPRHIEHMDMAERSGRTAGRNMAGGKEDFHYTPLFYSDLFEDGYEALGRLSTHFELIEVWDEAKSAAVIWYLEDDKVTGVLLWNTWRSVPKAREVAAASRAGTLAPAELGGQITPGGTAPWQEKT
ncbi:Anthranilate 1,2-dioxygenase system ferredoxin--NAD(+) reductase component [Corynebacterium occultum]|uniref:Anthranilate 1,2-dioxygenase system ferredoxin--NAD(+) reductase component n=1 Tax=Corynebacterium occultum TaxID=2675219 RepID=A0A6B8VW55_9CORY|nr:NAD(P)/FAD-dependent oxidoreductase [Corynebacterium occultum]QGU07359.1 Anthranilate 1,2-dioxygenase system ferredoxin--NAD(+) reductase component [Corynebacterium occultum]